MRSARAFSRIFACLCVLSVASAAPVWSATPTPARSRGGMVVSSQVDATRAGVAMLEAGGNAIDAAVATAFAVAVTQPFSTGLGGGAFILLRTAGGKAVAIDARETAPAAAARNMYTQPGVPERASLVGPLAVATPGLVAGLTLTQKVYGTMTLEQVMAPAIALARDGYAIDARHARMLGFMKERGLFARFAETARIQLREDGSVPGPGWVLVQSDLADTLERVATLGRDGFYRGPVADRIADDVARRGGLLTREDLAGYEVRIRDPLEGSYRGLEVLTFPPPSSGVILLQILNILEGFELGELGAGSSASAHRISEAMKLAFAHRAEYLGDADFVEVPVEKLADKGYAEELRKRINPAWWRRAPWTWGRDETAIEVPAPGIHVEDAGTTHLSVTDAAGAAVAITETINTPFGSGITVPGTGVILNNEMDDFSVAIGVPNAYGLVDNRGANAVAPGKRPLSSMTPTIVLQDGRVRMVTGSPGGSRIISTTALSIINVFDFDMDVKAAVSAPRFHHQWSPDKITVEPEIPEDVVEALRARGHEVEVSRRHWSAAEAIVVDPKSGWHFGGNDPRRDGLALGPASLPRKPSDSKSRSARSEP